MLLVLFGTCVVLLVCVDCLFPLHDVLEPKGKRYGRSAGNSFSCSAKMASATFSLVYYFFALFTNNFSTSKYIQ